MTLRVFFYCCDEDGNLQEDIIAIAEGLQALGISFYSNCNYWLQSTRPGDYLFRRDPAVGHSDCDVVVVTYTWPQWVRMGDFKARYRPLPQDLFARGRKYTTVFMDNNDGYRTLSWEREYRQFDVILRTKFNRRAYHPLNVRPWAYGWTNRVVEATSSALPFAARERTLLVNFGASHPFRHGARDLAQKKLAPKLRDVLPIDNTMDNLSSEPAEPYAALMWRQTGGRFNHAYYGRLKSTQAIACFCGDIIPPAPWRPERYLVGGNRARLRRLVYEVLGAFDPRAPRAIGCDSFRFWEGLAASCAVINVDLEHYGVALPTMPVNGEHYLGVDFARTDAFIERLIEEPGLLKRVGTAGRAWADRYYSPKAVAERFLAMFSASALATETRSRQCASL